MAEETFLDRLNTEYDQLLDRVNKLRTFLKNPKFLELDEEMKKLMHRQLTAMEMYLHVLGERKTLLSK